MTYESDPDFELPKISIAGVSDIPKLEGWLKTNSEARKKAVRRVNFLRKELHKWDQIERLAYRQENKIERKLTNLRRVKEGEPLPLNCWYELCSKEHYFYLLHLTPAGRGAGFGVIRTTVRDARKESMVGIWKSGWSMWPEYHDSGYLKECGQLTVLIATGINFSCLIGPGSELKRGNYKEYVVENDKLVPCNER